jgi:TRAP-type C4-dicarboxylate transport system permease small subunit
MKNVSSKLINIIENLFGLCGVVMILIESYMVLARNVMQIATPWADEVQRLLFIWSIFVVSAFAFLSDTLISLTLVEDSNVVRKRPVILGIIKITQYAAALIYSGVLSKQLITILTTQLTTGEVTAVLRYPLWVLNAGVFLGTALVVFFAILKIVNCRKYFVKTVQ